MPVAVVDDDAGHGNASTSSLTLSWDHLNDGGANYVVALCGFRRSGNNLGNATYNAVTMTQVGTEIVASPIKGGMFELTSPATGSNTVTVAMETTSSRICGISAAYSGVDTADPSDALQSVTGNPNDADPESDLAITTSADDMVTDMFCHEDTNATLTLDAGPTQHAASVQESALGTQDVRLASAFEDVTGASTTIGWNLTTSEDWIHLAFNINASAAAATSLVFPSGIIRNTLLRM